MCGIVGVLGSTTAPEALERMLDTIRHRGPDDEGVYVKGALALGMRRLSVIDVEGGHQPMVSEDGRYVIVFNGEIYNHAALRCELEQKRRIRFRTRSDTEVILCLYAAFGADCVNRLRGMFAFAIADNATGEVFIARDRLGIKPLYLWRQGRTLIFASEIKAILRHPAVSAEADTGAVDDYLALRYVPGPGTLFRGIEKFPAAHRMTWREGDVALARYWSLPLPAETAPRLSGNDYVDRFTELFEQSVAMHTISDVPVGAFLSGGLDSGAIVAALAARNSQPVKTFSVGFDWHGDELAGARRTADLQGCDHHEIICGAADFAALPNVVWHLDEPVGDAIVMPMFLLSRQARRHVTVVLTGEGADEVLAGYFMHKVLSLSHAYRSLMPRPLRAFARFAAARTPANLLNRFFDYPAALGEEGRRRLLSYLHLVESGDTAAQYRFIISLFGSDERAALCGGSTLAGTAATDAPETDSSLSPLERSLRLQYAHWLPDDILCKQDKMSMAHSIEGRVPFMDHELVEFLATVPPWVKLSRGRNKLLLRRYLERRLPHLSRQRKAPFYIPVDKYLSEGPLGEMTRDLLSEASVRRRGLFQWSYVRRLRDRLGEGEFLFGKQVFSLLALELWYRIFIDREGGWDIGAAPERRVAAGTPP